MTMSMVEYMYKLLYGRRLTTLQRTSQNRSLPGDVLRWRLSQVLQQCANTPSLDSGNIPYHPRHYNNGVIASTASGTRVCGSKSAIVPFSYQDESSFDQPCHDVIDHLDDSLPGRYYESGSRDCGSRDWSSRSVSGHKRFDEKPSCRYSRRLSVTSPDMVETVSVPDDPDESAAAVYHQLSTSGLLDVEDMPLTVPPSVTANTLSTLTDITMPFTVCKVDTTAVDDVDAVAMATGLPFQTSPAWKCDIDRMIVSCCCDQQGQGQSLYGEQQPDCACVVVNDDSRPPRPLPWQQVDEFYSLTAGYAFHCSRSIVYDARFSARWQHRKERQRHHCHGNRALATASTETYVVQDDCNGDEICHATEMDHPQRSTTAGKSNKMTADSLLCAVCGDNAACQHYGVRTCEGCKGFFKRTVQKNSKYVCLSGRNCIIDKRRRNRCQYCRFQKCLAVGMVKEVVRRDTLKGRRGRLPSKPKNQSNRSATSSSGRVSVSLEIRASHSPPLSLITALVRAFVDSSPDLPSLNYSQCCEIELGQLENVAISPIKQLCYGLIERSAEVLVQWAISVPGFNDLCSDDRDLILRNSLMELFILRLAYRLTPSDGYSVIFDDGTVLHSTQCQVGFSPEWMQSVYNMSHSLHSHPGAVDLSTVSCLAALVLFTDRRELVDGHRMELLQETILDTLRSHCIYRCGGFTKDSQSGNGRILLANTINKLVQLRTASRQCFPAVQQITAQFQQRHQLSIFTDISCTETDYQ